jgi:uncharacterized membrane protein YeaQ/YmgE (transglycosylase-associated protein family)
MQEDGPRSEEESMLAQAQQVHITVFDIVVYVIAGLIIGAIARLLLPGRQDIGLLATIAIGVVAAVIGGVLWELIFPGNDGIAWIGSIIVAVVLLYLYMAVTGGRRRSPLRG